VTLSSGDLTTLGNGTINVTASQTDAAGNAQTATAASTSFTLDNTAPTVSSVVISATGASGTQLNAGDVVTVTATYSENVSGQPTTAPTLTIGTETGIAMTPGTTTGNTRTWTYTISSAGTTDTGSISVAGDLVAGINDTAGNAATGTTPAATGTFTADTTAPTFSSLTTATFVERSTGTAYDAQTTEGDTGMTYTLSGGVDLNLFNINATTGAVTFKNAPNFDSPQDNGNNNVYDITVRATDLAGNATDRAVALTVTRPFVLDTLGNSGAASFSLRLLDADYAGKATKAIQVRRSGDGALADIGFTASGDLDTAALLAHVGTTGSGFVRTWYDQSGNGRHATQTDPTRQPKIVSNGVIETQNGRPVLCPDGIDDTMVVSSSGVTTYPLSINAVLFRLDANEKGAWVKLGGDNPDGVGIGIGASSFDVAGANLIGLKENVVWVNTSTTVAPQAIVTMLQPSGTSATEIYQNGVLSTITAGATNAPIAPSPSINLFGYGTTRLASNPTGEVHIFSSTLSTTDRQTLERNQGAYFGVTVA
jgi:hypothetical protein